MCYYSLQPCESGYHWNPLSWNAHTSNDAQTRHGSWQGGLQCLVRVISKQEGPQHLLSLFSVDPDINVHVVWFNHFVHMLRQQLLLKVPCLWPGETNIRFQPRRVSLQWLYEIEILVFAYSSKWVKLECTFCICRTEVGLRLVYSAQHSCCEELTQLPCSTTSMFDMRIRSDWHQFWIYRQFCLKLV